MVMALAVIGLDGQGALWKKAVDLVESVLSFQGNRLCRRELPSLVPISFYSFTFSCLRRGLTSYFCSAIAFTAAITRYGFALFDFVHFLWKHLYSECLLPVLILGGFK